jgi:cephalosporin hydroxylase
MSVIRIDEAAGLVIVEGPDGETAHPMSSPEAFALVSRAWLRCGWDAKYVYGFSWMGRPIIQLPDDMVRIQEVIYRVRPDVIVETGVAHGGSLIFYASLCKAMEKGRIIGVDIEIRPHNRAAIEAHEMSSWSRGARPTPRSWARCRRRSVPARPCWSCSTAITPRPTCWRSSSATAPW